MKKNNIILKLGLNHKALAKEAQALSIFSNFGSVRLIASEPGLLIMQRAIPGDTLKSYFNNQENKSIEILCNIVKQLHKAKITDNNNFYNISELLKILDNNLEIPDAILLKARTLRDELLSSADKDVLLHGDLHHENILQHQNSWRVIDPKGFIGESAYEVAAFIRNPYPELIQLDNFNKIINNRIKLIAELLNLDPDRIRNWHYVQAVLCWGWALEDNLKEVANYFAKLVYEIKI